VINLKKERPTKNKLRLKGHLKDENPFAFHTTPNIQVDIGFNNEGVKITGGSKKKGRR
jgi:hypothetical protein